MNYDDQYYILMRPDVDNYPLLIATDKTAERDYEFSPIPMLSEALFFRNQNVIDAPEVNHQHPKYSILIEGLSFLTITEIKKQLFQMGLKGMRFHPAVYIVNENNWQEDYWYLNIYSELDCWDRGKSEFNQLSDDNSMPAHIDKYVLDATILDNIAEDDRLIFRMGGDLGSALFIHQRIIDYFESANVTGYRAFKVSEYEFGMEFRP